MVRTRSAINFDAHFESSLKILDSFTYLLTCLLTYLSNDYDVVDESGSQLPGMLRLHNDWVMATSSKDLN